MPLQLIFFIALLFLLSTSNVILAGETWHIDEIDIKALELEDNVVAWRRQIHQNPELGNREFETANLVAKHLVALNFDQVQTEVAHTGGVGLLRGSLPGPVVALRADMDALPVTEKTGLPYASTKRALYNGQEVGVMHACGHDAHVAILMGVAEILASMRDRMPGTIMFIFQPAEEGPPEGEEGGAALMVAEGVFDDPRPEAIFGLHIGTRALNTIHYGIGPTHASADVLKITVEGQQTHGASPWRGVDPIVVASQIVLGIQTIHSRQIDTREAAVISIGSIHGGVRHNIIPEEVNLIGTIRTHDPEVRLSIKEKIERTATNIAASAGATARVSYGFGVPVAINDAKLVNYMIPTLDRVAGSDSVYIQPAGLGYEDFAYFEQQVPGMFISLGARPENLTKTDVAPNHSPYFVIDESALILGVRTLANLAMDFLISKK